MGRRIFESYYNYHISIMYAFDKEKKQKEICLKIASKRFVSDCHTIYTNDYQSFPILYENAYNPHMGIDSAFVESSKKIYMSLYWWNKRLEYSISRITFIERPLAE